ncbi:FRG domain-containing protein [Gluconacetobacter entanii]|uniref:FRG domain-containing protein n=1 Tax=Gluconacetobacter entanii TaxID=108528 RepID=UPI001C934063|nr:FRG domain-containing protein [Gluconacetobacter entanii]MBY4641516.1 FRG domain-containing protein [Gluconacetobacter entanii]MCW4579005.1 FRG domain-containing protein [Gluconacetobacter entanii]MCW4582398.1 FRG domain-containing protein [Gluconacetobacter entanii]MCW4585789.1 FRG domain-containing protein [Gluconacetobacter entanii]
MSEESLASPLSNIFIPGSEIVADSASGREVFHVTNPHALTQAAGYLKFIEGPARRGVFFRGQRKLYKTLSPTLFRDIATQEAQSRRISALRQACASIARKNIIFDQIPPEAHEPLLQHYGLNTSWLDLVDNIWIALWFACHRAMAVGPRLRTH